MSYYDKLTDLGIKLTRRSGSEKTQCPKCYDGRKNKHRKDLNVNITTGEYKCHNTPCEFRGNVRAFERKAEKKEFIKPDKNLIRKIALTKKAFEFLHKRNISEATLKRYMVYSKEEWMPIPKKPVNTIAFPYIRNGELVNVKFRDAAKGFKMIKDAELILFGMQFLAGRKHMIIVEGEVDCLSLAECGYGMDTKENVDTESGEVTEDDVVKDHSKWCPVSVPNGATVPNPNNPQPPNLEYLDNCFEDLIDIHEFIVAVDDDPAGRALKDELIRRLGVERCRFVVYPKDQVVPLENNLHRACKDLNEVLMYLGEDAVHAVIESAKFIPIEGVYYLKDLYPTMLEKFRRGVKMGDTTRMGADMDLHFRWKKGNLIGGVGYGNHGKTTFQNQLELSKSIYDGWKHAVFCPENYPADDFYDDLIEVFVGCSLERMQEEQYEFACRFIQDHFFYVYPEDEHDLFSILERFRNLVLKKGIDTCRIDPWNQLDKKYSQYGMTNEERLSVDLKTAKRFALMNNICLTILAHPKNPTYAADKSLPVVDMYDMAGGAQWGNKLDDIWSYYRPNWHIDKQDPTIEIHFQKIKRKRTGGKLGIVRATLDWDTRRFVMSDGIAPCDVALAEKVLRAENYDQGILGDLFPDTSGDELPF